MRPSASTNAYSLARLPGELGLEPQVAVVAADLAHRARAPTCTVVDPHRQPIAMAAPQCRAHDHATVVEAAQPRRHRRVKHGLVGAADHQHAIVPAVTRDRAPRGIDEPGARAARAT